MSALIVPGPALPSYRYQILCWGDSITQFGGMPNGWVSQLSSAYFRRCDVFNRGYSGYNSRWLRVLIDKYLASRHETEKVLFSTVKVGANDAAGWLATQSDHEGPETPTPNPGQHIPLSEYVENVEYIVRQLSKVSHLVVLVAPPCVDNTRWPDRCDKAVEKYAEACTAITAKLQAEGVAVELLNFYDVSRAHDRSKELFNDGLHLSDEGNSFLFENIMKTVGKHPELLPASLTIDYPVWKEVDNSDVAATQASLSTSALEKLHSVPQAI